MEIFTFVVIIIEREPRRNEKEMKRGSSIEPWDIPQEGEIKQVYCTPHIAEEFTTMQSNDFQTYIDSELSVCGRATVSLQLLG